MNTKSKQLIQNTIIVAIGKICTQFVSFILLPFYTAYLTSKQYGVVDLLNTYISLLIPLVFLQIDQAVFRFLIDTRDNNKKKSSLITTTLFFVTIESFLYIVVYLLVSSFVSNNYKIFLGVNVIAAMYSNLILQISRGMGDNKNYSYGCIVSGIGTILLNIILVKFHNMGAYGVLISSLIANILCTVFVFIKKNMYKYIHIQSLNINYLKKMLKYSIPLVPNMLSWWIINVSDRTLISALISISANGVYSVSNKFSSIFISVFNIFNMTWSESASMYIKDKERDLFFSKVVNEAMILFSTACICGIAIMPLVFNILISGESYKEAYNQISILFVATIFNIFVSLLGSVYVALKKTKEIAKTSIYAAIINIILNLIFIKYIGLYAASISTLIAYFIMSIYRFVDIKKYVNIVLDKKN